jgi:Nickel responsive protein SCO4226-like
MTRFIVVHPVAFKDEDLLALRERRDELPSSVVWRSSLVADADRLTFCEWESPDERQLHEIFEAFGVPYSAVHEVRLFDPAARLTKVA